MRTRAWINFGSRSNPWRFSYRRSCSRSTHTRPRWARPSSDRGPRAYPLGPVATISIDARISSVTLSTRNGTDGAVIPKSPNFQLGFAVAVAPRSLPSRFAVTSNVTSLVLPLIVMFPVSVNVNVPLVASGSARPLVFVGTKFAVGNWRTCNVSFLMKLSRSRSSLESVVRSNVTLDPDSNVPSALSSKEPFAPVAVRTASDGRLTPTSCSRTRMVAFDLSVTVQVPADAVVLAAVAVAVVVVVGVGVGLRVDTVAEPPHAATSIAAPRAPAIERTRAGVITIKTPPLVTLTVRGSPETAARGG